MTKTDNARRPTPPAVAVQRTIADWMADKDVRAALRFYHEQLVMSALTKQEIK
jgi:hypothetical protein